MFDQLVFTFVR